MPEIMQNEWTERVKMLSNNNIILVIAQWTYQPHSGSRPL